MTRGELRTRRSHWWPRAAWDRTCGPRLLQIRKCLVECITREFDAVPHACETLFRTQAKRKSYGLSKSGLWSRNSNFRLRLHASKFLAPAPTFRKFWLRIQNGLIHWKLKTIALFVQLACSTSYVCGTGTQISSSESFWLPFHLL